MKNLLSKKLSFFAASILSLFFNAYVFAQEKTLDVDVDINKGDTSPQGILSNPLYIIIGVLVLLLFIALIVRGGKK